jgi:hypothetical protein
MAATHSFFQHPELLPFVQRLENALDPLSQLFVLRLSTDPDGRLTRQPDHIDSKIAQTGQIAPLGTAHPSSAGVAPGIRGDQTLAMALEHPIDKTGRA